MSTPSTGRPRGRPRHPEPLTPAEQRVLEHLRQGLTNVEIATRLGVSPETVKYHVANMLAKLGLRNRRELASWQPDRERVAGRRRSFLSLPRLPGALAEHRLAASAGMLGVLAGIAAVSLLFALRSSSSSSLPAASPAGEAEDALETGAGEPGTLLAYVKDECQGCGKLALWILEAESGQSLPVSLPEGWDDVEPRGWLTARSPSMVVSHSEQTDVPGDVYVINLARSRSNWQMASSQRITDNEQAELVVLVAPQSNRIAAYCDPRLTGCVRPLTVFDPEGRVVLTAPEGRPLAWSPDGEVLAYATPVDSAREQLRFVTLEGGEPAEPIVVDGKISQAAYSASGKRVAFSYETTVNGVGETSIALLDLPGRAVTHTVPGFAVGTKGDLQWDGDSRLWARGFPSSGGTAAVFEASIPAPAAETVGWTQPAALRDAGSFAWSPGYQWLATVRLSTQGLRVSNRAGEGVDVAGPVVEMVWSAPFLSPVEPDETPDVGPPVAESEICAEQVPPEGGSVLSLGPEASVPTGEPGFWLLDLEESSARQLSTGDDTLPTWSPDGSRLAYVRAVPSTGGIIRHELRVVDEDGGGGVVLRAGGSLYWGRPISWAEDGERLAFVQLDEVVGEPPEQRSSLWVWDLRAGCARKLMDLPYRGDVYWLWEDGRLLVQVSESKWQFVDPATGEASPAADFELAASARTNGSQLSSDQRRLLVWVREGFPWIPSTNGGFIADVATGDVRKVSDVPLRGASDDLRYALTWGFIEDGQLYTDRGGPGALVDLETGDILATHELGPVGFSPGGTVAAWPILPDGAVVSYESAFGQRLFAFAAYPLVWLGERELLATDYGRPATLFWLDLDAGTAEVILSAPAIDCAATATSGRVIISPGDRGLIPPPCQLPYAGFIQGDNSAYGNIEAGSRR